MARIAKGGAAGLFAGLVAAWAMDVFQARIWPAPDTGDDDPTTVVAAERLWRGATGDELPQDHAPFAGSVVHYALGAGLGMVYGATAAAGLPITRGFGVPFGLAAAVILDEALVPAIGLTKPPWRYRPAVHAYSMASHVVFGGVLEGMRAALRSFPARRAVPASHRTRKPL